MFLATQYYRPPFPDRRYWPDDLSRIRDAGLHAIQLWCLWGWIESEPGVFRYDDYDTLIRLADERGLKVVLSSIAEIQPFWIHRLVPGCELVDHLGRPQVSCPRNECNVGLTPGGCFDHPRVAEMMRRFLDDLARRYARCGNLLGWDCWNETRWTVHADGYTCYCEHTLERFREWLRRRYGDLAGLNAAWKRRYAHWDDVRPSKRVGGPYTDVIAFQQFLTWRAGEHVSFRCDALRRADGRHVVTAHGGQPSVHGRAGGYEQPLCRGNDWDFADRLDGVGSSHFPVWMGMRDEEFVSRLEAVRSAARDKIAWISELQGGSSRGGIAAERGVAPAEQQRWIFHGLARGAKGVIFWCWRDEVFCSEASGFGLSGWDGHAQARLAAMKRTGALLDAHARLLEAYRPDPPRVGLLFAPDNYYLKWARDGHADEPVRSLVGYAMALERLGIAYEFVEADHAEAADGLDVLLMPWCLVLPVAARKAAVRLLRRGGRLLLEAETDAYDPTGFYRYPDERPLLRALGLHDLGRRPLGDDAKLAAELDGEVVEIPLENFVTPLTVPRAAAVLGADADGQVLLVRRPVGRGAAYVLGGFAGTGYYAEPDAGLEALLRCVCRDAGVTPDFLLDVGQPGQSGVYWRTGRAGRKRLLWLTNTDDRSARTVTITDARGHFQKRRAAAELLTGRKLPFTGAADARQCTVRLPAGGSAVLCW